MDQQDVIAVAIVGAGRRAAAHLAALEALPERYRLVAVCDLDAATARALAARATGEPRQYQQLEQLLDAHPELGLVDLITPIATHHAIAIELARRGVAVLCEAPIALTTPLADLMIDAARQHGTRLLVAESIFRDPWPQIWRRVVEAGVVGRVLRLHLVSSQPAHHAVNLLRALAGGASPRRVRAIGRLDRLGESVQRAGLAPAERWLHGLLEDDRGGTWIYEHSNLAQADVLGRGALRRCQVDGDRGTIVNDRVFDCAGGKERCRRLITERDGQGTPIGIGLQGDPAISWRHPLAGAASAGLVETLEVMAAWICQGVTPDHDATAARLELAVAVALEQSAASGGELIELPLAAGVTDYEMGLHRQFAALHGFDLADLEAVRALRLANR